MSSESDDDVPIGLRIEQHKKVGVAATTANGLAPAREADPPQNGTNLPAAASEPKGLNGVQKQTDGHHAAAKPAVVKPPTQAVTANGGSKPKPIAGLSDDDSDDDLPIAKRAKPVSNTKPLPKPIPKPAPKPAAKPKPTVQMESSDDESGDEDSATSSDDGSSDDEPLIARKSKVAARSSSRQGSQDSRPSSTRKRKAVAPSPSAKRQRSGGKDDDKPIKWNTLEHAGVLFPPEYEPLPNGLKMLYDGKPVELTPEQEEVAQLFAVMKETDYMQKPKFIANFWEDWKAILGKNHVIKDLSKCDFTPFYEYNMKLREEKKNKTKEEKEKDKKEKEAREAKFKFALVDDKKEQVGNFRVEPPGLFRGRGEHPKMGKLKRRIYPKDITINIGEGIDVPEHPYPGQQWKEVRHDKTVTWLAYWRDPINSKEYKYVWLAANSSFKTDSDLAKYEKARKLKDYIGDIRRTYEADWEHKESDRRQMAVALYFIDKLALRAGHEKDDDEADTVGCCTLKCENVELMEDNHIRFDFLGKDSIRYENEVEVHPKVFRNVKEFKAKHADGTKKKPDDQLFEAFDATALNQHLKGLMDGLSVKVFRTYNASITLDKLLHQPNPEFDTVDQRKAHYDRANKEVAVLCNHQRSIPKGHNTSMEKMQQKIKDAEDEVAALQKALKQLKAGTYKPEDGKKMPTAEQTKSKLDKKKQQLEKLHLQAKVKDDLKTVALGTSKINYMDPRITVSWCKRHEVPIEKIFNKSLLSKFLWAMDVDPDYRF